MLKPTRSAFQNRMILNAVRQCVKYLWSQADDVILSSSAAVVVRAECFSVDKISFMFADFTRKVTKRVSITEASRRTETGMLLGFGLDQRLAKRYVHRSLVYHHLSRW